MSSSAEDASLLATIRAGCGDEHRGYSLSELLSVVSACMSDHKRAQPEMHAFIQSMPNAQLADHIAQLTRTLLLRRSSDGADTASVSPEVRVANILKHLHLNADASLSKTQLLALFKSISGDDDTAELEAEVNEITMNGTQPLSVANLQAMWVDLAGSDEPEAQAYIARLEAIEDVSADADVIVIDLSDEEDAQLTSIATGPVAQSVGISAVAPTTTLAAVTQQSHTHTPSDAPAASEDSPYIIVAKKPEAEEKTKKKKLDPKDFRFMNENNKVLVKRPGQINGIDFRVCNVKKSTLLLLDWTSQVFVDQCEDCTIVIGPVEGAVFIRDCKNCVIHVMCRQFRTRNVTDCTFHLFCATNSPIIESSHSVVFKPWVLGYPGLQAHFDQCKFDVNENYWSTIFDFTPKELPEFLPHAKTDAKIIHRMSIAIEGHGGEPENPVCVQFPSANVQTSTLTVSGAYVTGSPANTTLTSGEEKAKGMVSVDSLASPADRVSAIAAKFSLTPTQSLSASQLVALLSVTSDDAAEVKAEANEMTEGGSVPLPVAGLLAMWEELAKSAEPEAQAYIAKLEAATGGATAL
jgi:hypothetical protein